MVETLPQDLGAGGIPPTSNTRSPLPRTRPPNPLPHLSQLADVAKALDQANRDDLAQLYDALGLAVAYDHRAHAAEVSITPAQHGLARVSEEEHAP